MKSLVLATVLSSVLLSSCATSPLGRNQVAFLPEEQMSQMGIQAFDELKQKTPVETSSQINSYVKCIASAIIKEVGGQWEVVVFRDDSANAFALPGSKIGVHTGILKVAQTPSQLAAVIGHEIAHVLSKHSNERASQEMLVKEGLNLTKGFLGAKGADPTVAAVLGLGAEVGILLPYSRTHESEADLYGLDLMAKAGFDPRESVQLWENMSKASGNKNSPSFLSTHPSHATRIQELQNRIHNATTLYNQAKAAGKNSNCKL